MAIGRVRLFMQFGRRNDMMPEVNPPKHGGARAGAGRKAADGARGLVLVSVRLTRHQREKLRRLGGSVWVRKAVDEAAEKNEIET